MQLLAAVLFFILRWFCKRVKWLHEKKMWWLPFAFFVLGVWSLLFWPLPFWGGTVATGIATLFNWIFGGAAALLGGSAGVIATIVLILVLLGTTADLIDGKADRWAKFSVFLIAPLALVASAEFAPWLLTAVQSVSGVGPQVLSAIA
ncbi:hypothetical protein GCM10027174_44900 [Salinifilum aidingensis]